MTSQFVEIYHPGLTSTARVSSQSLDEWYARGWLLVDPDAPPPTVSTPYYTTEAADTRFVQSAVLLDVAGTVKDAKLPTRLSDTSLRAAFATPTSAAGIAAGMALVFGG